jgi:hypothetical protein
MLKENLNKTSARDINLKITKNTSKSLMLRINGVTFECARPYRICPFILK